jgi:hypothetical protein
MNTPPPPPPPGFDAYPAASGPPKNHGLTVAGFVLSLVGVIPCFWAFQVPGILGLIFGLVGRKQIAASNGRLKGGGLATAAIVIGLILVAACAALWAYIALSGNCDMSGGRLSCSSGN